MLTQTPDKFKLSAQELMELKNIQLQKRLNQAEADKTTLEEVIWAKNVNARTQLDMRNYSVDISNGECTRLPQAIEPKQVPDQFKEQVSDKPVDIENKKPLSK